ncbi:MAG: ABC transporter ATP-binding protein [Candidatus Omnitrophica bacterium]|nr:ABC transporter ATP-binding protein [Candidatus Omnitrophota bacterium]
MTDKAVEINGLSYSYPDGTAALDNIGLEISKGESLGIVGPNGAGKSTLLLHLNGILRRNGSVKVLGMDVNDDNLPLIRGKVGLIFQDPDSQLFMPTVREDVSFGPVNMMLARDEVDRRVKGALEEVDMSGFLDRPSHHLSFGEKRRVSIATVLSMKPEILALDEPSSNLDPKHRRDLINFLKGIKLTKIIATHDLELVLEVCSRVVLLDKGRVVACGDNKAILKDRDLLDKHNLEVPYSLRQGSINISENT